ncbi:3-hydroxyacyl-CoA dehydrogenase family protein [Anseongella ginsenosidimutans]|uniref:3-hydroxyacyl-CoA dehydrogenase family protein n=1 Tax=Anseongella ginsenosidimutans TaxID=496056 RepID=UPI0032C41DBF
MLCKDTPAFIANRVGVYSISQLFHYVAEKGLSVEEVDKYTGPVLGRPKSATFRTADVVGLDTLARVARGLYEHCPEDEERELFRLPAFVEKMLANNRLGAKTGEGFYKKVKKEDGSTEILSLRLDSLEYGPQAKVASPALDAARSLDSLEERLKFFATGTGEPAGLFRANSFGLFSYCSRRIPEIADELYRIDDAMRAGFGWEKGPFELWDLLGVAGTLEAMEKAGNQAAAWVKEMLAAGCSSFYRLKEGRKEYYDLSSKAYREVPGSGSYLSPGLLKRQGTVWKNAGVTLADMGEGILNCEFHTKMNTMGSEVIEGLNKAIAIAEKDFRGMVIANEGQDFSAGANLALVLMYAAEQEWEEIDLLVRAFQDTMMRMRYSAVPVVAAPHNRALGGGCELCLHADHVHAHAELYMGLVEFGVGIIPAGGGTKEFARRAAEERVAGGIDDLEILKNRYMTIAMAKVSTSAAEAFELGYLDRGSASVSINRKRQLSAAKKKAIEIARGGYVQPVPRNDIRVLGRQGLGMFTVGGSNMFSGNYISAHDRKISEKLAWVICGGDLSAPAEVSERYLLDLEREAFLSLCGERKTLERMQSILSGGKVLRN